MASHNLVKELDQNFEVTSEVINAASKAGVTLNFEQYGSHVHVCADLLGKLDHVYIKHFHKGDLNLLDCFNIYEGEHHQLFLAYIENVSGVLDSHVDTPQFETSRDGGDPQAIGLEVACRRLKPLFYPLEGRVCLPLATVSMIEDLKTTIITTMDNSVISQVRNLPSF